MEIIKKTVKDGDKQMEVFIIDDGSDRVQLHDIEQAVEGRTIEQMRKQPPKEKAKLSPSERKEALKETNEYFKRKRSEHPKKFY